MMAGLAAVGWAMDPGSSAAAFAGCAGASDPSGAIVFDCPADLQATVQDRTDLTPEAALAAHLAAIGAGAPLRVDHHPTKVPIPGDWRAEQFVAVQTPTGAALAGGFVISAKVAAGTRVASCVVADPDTLDRCAAILGTLAATGTLPVPIRRAETVAPQVAGRPLLLPDGCTVGSSTADGLTVQCANGAHLFWSTLDGVPADSVHLLDQLQEQSLANLRAHGAADVAGTPSGCRMHGASCRRLELSGSGLSANLYLGVGLVGDTSIMAACMDHAASGPGALCGQLFALPLP